MLFNKLSKILRLNILQQVVQLFAWDIFKLILENLLILSMILWKLTIFIA